MALNLLLRSETGGPINQTQHDANFVSIQDAINALNPDPGAVRTTGFTLAASDANSLIVCTAAITVTVPAAGTLGNGFSCDILADGAAVTLNGPGATNMTLADGEIGSVFVANSKVRSAKGSTTRLD